MKTAPGCGSLNKGDCSIQSLSNCLGLPYNAAMKLARLAGWQPGKGVGILDFIKLLQSGNTGKEFSCFVVGNSRQSRLISAALSLDSLPPINVAELQQIESGNKNKLIVWTTGHFFAMIHAEIQDSAPVKGSTRILGIFQLTN